MKEANDDPLQEIFKNNKMGKHIFTNALTLILITDLYCFSDFVLNSTNV